jgi:phosphoribosyl 1,2-cyclic phosphodiesterase
VLRFRSLGSGSSGNATLVEALPAWGGGTGTRLLIDCGLPLRELESRLLQAGVEPTSLGGIFITHEHSDHIGCAARFSTKHSVPVWMSHGTWRGARSPDFEGRLQWARDGESIDLGGLEVLPFAVPHDAIEPLQLSCGNGRQRIGILTDLGHMTDSVLGHLQGCDALLLECNHDPRMLERGPYPPFLKARVGGIHGHLSNAQAAEIAAHLDHANLGRIVAAHLSAQNNHPDLAVAALAGALGRPHDEITVASQQHGCEWIHL